MRRRMWLLVWLGIGLFACGIDEDEEPLPPGTLYVSEGVSSEIRKLDLASGELTPLTDLPITSALTFVVAPRDPFLVINRGPLYRFDLRTRQLDEIVNGDDFHANFAVSASGTLLAYRSSEPTSLVLRVRAIGTEDDLVIPGLGTWESIFALHWLGDTALVFLRGDPPNRRAWRVRADATGLEPIGEPAGATIFSMSVDPSSRFMALLRSSNFDSDGAATLSIVDLVSLEERVVATLQNVVYPLAWSPDGRFIAATMGRSQDAWDVALIDTRNGDLRFLETEGFQEFFVEWSVE